jgi:transcriptional regulator with XRE-family HTH domain
MANTFGQNLKRIRDERGLTQSKLGELAGLTQQGIDLLERGARLRPRLDTILALAAALDCKPEELYGPAPTKAVA